MHDLAVDQGLERIQDLRRILQDNLLRYGALFFDFGKHIPAVAVLQHEVVVMRGFFECQ